MSETQLNKAISILPKLTAEELSTLSKEIEAKLAEFDSENAPLSEYQQAQVDAVKHTITVLEEYQTPAVKAAINLSFLMGLVCGIPVAGFGALPKESAKRAAALLAASISDMEAENRRFKTGMSKWLGIDQEEEWFYTQGALRLRDALVAYYSGEDNGTRLATIFKAAPMLSNLLELRAAYKTQPGGAPDITGVIMDQIISERPEKWMIQKAQAALRDLQQTNEYPDVVAMLTSVSYNKRAGWLRLRQYRRRNRNWGLD